MSLNILRLFVSPIFAFLERETVKKLEEDSYKSELQNRIYLTSELGVYTVESSQ